MYSSLMNALIRLLLSHGNKINCLKGKIPRKDSYGCAGTGIRFPGFNFCLGIRLWEVTFARDNVFGDFFMNNA